MSNVKNNDIIRIVRGSDRFAGSPDNDMELKISLDSKFRNKIEGDRNVIVNVDDLFNSERQKSSKFRISGKITNIFNNTITGKTQYDPFKNVLYYTNEIDAKNNGTEYAGYPQFYEFSFYRYSGITNHISFKAKSAGTYNWATYITYPSGENTTQNIRYDGAQSRVSDGIPYKILNRVVNGSRLITFYCGFKHNLSVGEFIKLPQPVNGISYFEVYSLGDQAYGNDDRVFNIFDYGFTGNTFYNNARGTFKRVINLNNTGETTSEYYVRTHKTLTEIQNVDIHKLGFENNPFYVKKKLEYSGLTPNETQRVSVKDGSQTVGFSFDKDIDISGLKDNRDRPISELFVTIINKGYMGWFNNPYVQNNPTGIQIGWDFNFLPNKIDEWWRITNSNNRDNIPNKAYTINNTQFHYNADLALGHELKGDICEWNDYEQTETVLSKMYHKLSYNPNVFDNSNSNYLSDGYGYIPHHSIKIRDYSDYIELGDRARVENIPDYSFYSEYDGKWRWRDLYLYGYIDSDGNGVNYPFLNGKHYPFKQIIFTQTPIQRDNTVYNSIIFEPLRDDCE